MLCNEVAIEVFQRYFGHGDPLLGVVTHGGARALAGHCHALPGTHTHTHTDDTVSGQCAILTLVIVLHDWKVLSTQTGHFN